MSELKVRHLVADFSGGFPRLWVGNDPFRTHTFSALSMTFPLGETLFCSALRAVPAGQVDAALAADIAVLIGQEVQHLRLHRQFNAQLLKQGFPYDREQKWAKWCRYVGQLPLADRLAITSAFEHYTSALAFGVLRYPEWLEDAEPSLYRFFAYHGCEECSHRAVAFDTYVAVGGTYWRRIARFVQVSMVFAREVGLQTILNLRRDDQLFKLRTGTSAMRTWFGRRGMAWSVFAAAIRYLRPSFHPSQYGDDRLVEAWFARHADAFHES